MKKFFGFFILTGLMFSVDLFAAEFSSDAAGSSSGSASSSGSISSAGASLFFTQKTTFPHLQLEKILIGHTAWVSSVAYSPNCKTLVSGAGDKTIRIWNVEDGVLLEKFTDDTGVPRSVVYSPDGTRLASSSWNKSVCIWDLTNNELLDTLDKHISGVHSVAWAPDGETLALGYFNGTGCICDTKAVTSVTAYLEKYSSDDETENLDTEYISNTKYVKVLNTFAGNTIRVNSVAYSPDGKTLATGTLFGDVCLWTISGKLLKTLNHKSAVHYSIIRSVVYSPNGTMLASGNFDGTVCIWDAVSGKCIKTLTGHTGAINSVAYSPDGKYIVSGSDDTTVRLWNATSGKCLQTLTGHTRGVCSVAWSSDGETVASGSEDCTVRIWRNFSCSELKKTVLQQSAIAFKLASKQIEKVPASYEMVVRLGSKKRGDK